MTDTELRALAAAAMAEGWYDTKFFTSIIDDDDDSVFEAADAAYIAAMSPEQTIALLDERDALTALVAWLDAPRDQGLTFDKDVRRWWREGFPLRQQARAALGEG